MNGVATEGLRRPNPVSGVVWLLPWLAPLGLTVLLASNGRLVADDYCNTSRVIEHGVGGATLDILRTWHGGWSADLVLSVFGWLLLHLPPDLGYVPFVLTTVVLVVLAARAASVILDPEREGALRSRGVPVMTTVLLLSLAVTSREQSLMFGAFLWQAASVVHLWPALLSLVLLAWVYELRKRPGRPATVSIIVGTIAVAGFNFTETAMLGVAATVLSLVFFAVSQQPVAQPGTTRTALRYGGVAATSVVAFVVMYLAPGTAIRQEALALPDTSLGFKATQLAENVGALVTASVGRPGVVIAALYGLALALASDASLRAAMVRRSGALVLITATVGTAGILLAAAAEVASYPAPWHALALIHWWALTFVAAGICIGHAVALTVAEWEPGSLRLVRFASRAVVPLMSLLLIFLTVGWIGPLSARAAAWDRGDSAAMAMAADRETEWVNGCWSDLVEWGYEGGGAGRP